MTVRDKPKFAEMPGASLAFQPPFSFPGMSVRLFPLRANLANLQHFIDAYLNTIPPELGRFRVPAPFVSLMMLDYGKMAIEAGNYGYLAQREIVFNINLEWYKVVNGKWQFHDWATIAPYIYVDDDLSMFTGRMVYGWPKFSAALEATRSDWMTNAQAPVREALVRTQVFSELYSSKRLEMQPLLGIERDGPISLFRMPFDQGLPLTPWGMAAQIAQTAAGFSRDALGMMQGYGLAPTLVPGQRTASVENFMAMANRMASMAFPPNPNLTANTINLKQFRRAEDPNQYCYQAVTNGPMRLTAFNGGGLLGEDRLLLGDSSGGYSIMLHQWPSLPIAQTLGLEVARQVTGEGCDIAVLKPVMPIWYNVDMLYEVGENVAWRTHDGVWSDAQDRAYPLTVGEPSRTDKLFDTTLGAANRTITGPFHFTDTTIRVLPLLAYRDKLDAFLQSTFNDPLGVTTGPDGTDTTPDGVTRMVLWGPNDDSKVAHVYLTATSFGPMTSASNDIGEWASYEVSFLIPVRREEKIQGEWKVKGVGAVPAFTYVDNATATASNNEVLGIPTVNAVLDVPETRWMDLDGPSNEVLQSLLDVQAEVLPVIGAGEKSQRRNILNVSQGRPSELVGEMDWRVIADSWGDLLKSELKRKQELSKDYYAMKRAEALAIEVLGNRWPISLYTLKQYRDIADPTSACYQALIRVPRTLTEVFDLREIDQPLTVCIHEYPSQPIVAMLGLIGHQVEGTGKGIVYALQPQRPFWMTVTMDEGLGENVQYRASSHGWQNDDKRHPSYLDSSEADRVVFAAVRMMNSGDPRRLREAALSRVDWRTDEPRIGDWLDPEWVFQTVDPQAIVESVLSKEWANCGESSQWWLARRTIEADHARSLAGVAEGHLAEAEEKFFLAALAWQGNHPLELGGQAREMVPVLREFTEKRYHLEYLWQKLTEVLGPVRKVEGPGLADKTADPSAALSLAQARLHYLDAAFDICAKPLHAGYRPKGSGRTDADLRLYKLLVDEYRDLNHALGAPQNWSQLTEVNKAMADAAAALAADSPPRQQDGPSEEQSRSAEVKVLRRAVSAGVDEFEKNVAAEVERRRLAAAAAVERGASAPAPDAPMPPLFRGLSEEQLRTQLRTHAHARREIMREIVRLARARCDEQRENLFTEYSRAARMPDYRVWRGSTGTERDRIFPMSQSWDENWYVGAEVAAPKAESTSSESAGADASPEQVS